MKGLLPKVSDEHVPKVFYLQVVVEVVTFTEGASLRILLVYNMHIEKGQYECWTSQGTCLRMHYIEKGKKTGALCETRTRYFML